MGRYWRVRTSIEFPDSLFRRAKAYAVARGRALKERLGRGAKVDVNETAELPWMAGFGGLSDLGDDRGRIREAINDELGGAKGSRGIPDARAPIALPDRKAA